MLADSVQERRAVFNPIVGWWKEVSVIKPLALVYRSDTSARQADTLGAVHFELPNHLGNVVAVISDRKIAVDTLSPLLVKYYLADRILLRDYYAFGMTMPGRQWSMDSSYRFGFNGKENLSIAGWQDYGMRFYDTKTCRFISVDPHAENYPSISPYAYVANNPINAIDPDGRDLIFVIWTTGTGNNGVGHAGIAVSNYKQETYMETVNGVELERTRMVADGTYTFYDNWPGGDGVNFDLKGALTSVEAHRNITLIGSESEFTNGSTVSPNEQVAPDGVLKLSISYEQDMAVKGRLDKANEQNTDYNGAWYNCSSYASDGLKGIFGKKVGRESMLGPIKSITPNQLWKDTQKAAKENNIGTDILKDPGTGVDNKFKETMKGGNRYE